MLIINLENVENLIFNDIKIRNLLSDLRHIFDQWLLSVRVPYLRSLKLRSFVDLINVLNSDHILLLEDYFQDTITLDRLDYRIVKNVDCKLDLINLKELGSNYTEFTISRNADQMYISLWR